MPAEAVAQLEKAAALSPEPNTMASLAHAYAISGQKEKALTAKADVYWRRPASHEREPEAVPDDEVFLRWPLILHRSRVTTWRSPAGKKAWR